MNQARFFSLHHYRGGMRTVKALLLALCGAYLLQLAVQAAYPGWVDTFLALSRFGLAHGFVWQLVTYMFLHGSLMHLLVNALGLYFAGREVEALVGPRHFLRIFFLGGIIGGLVQLAAGPRLIELYGASGGVCAVLLAFTTLMPELEITALLFFVLPIRMRAKWLGRAVILLSIAFAVFGGQSNIGHMAHLGGALVGWLYVRRLGYGLPLPGLGWLRKRRSRREEAHYVSEAIDPILDKIAREGIHSLTPEERQALERGREHIARRVDRRE